MCNKCVEFVCSIVIFVPFPMQSHSYPVGYIPGRTKDSVYSQQNQTPAAAMPCESWFM